MTLKMNRETGHFEAAASFKFWVWVGGVVCAIMSALITYTITLTMAFSGVRQDIALLSQKVELQQKAMEARVGAVETQRSALEALAAAVQANTAAVQVQSQQLPPPRRGGGQP